MRMAWPILLQYAFSWHFKRNVYLIRYCVFWSPVRRYFQVFLSLYTVLCKRNANEILGFSFFVLAKIRRNFATKFRQSAREFSSSQTKIRCHLGEISHPLKRNSFVLPKLRRCENSQLRNFAIVKIRAREISAGRKFAAAKFPQSEILLTVEEGCNKNLLLGPL